jgi:hypothetical protein
MIGGYDVLSRDSSFDIIAQYDVLSRGSSFDIIAQTALPLMVGELSARPTIGIHEPLFPLVVSEPLWRFSLYIIFLTSKIFGNIIES